MMLLVFTVNKSIAIVEPGEIKIKIRKKLTEILTLFVQYLEFLLFNLSFINLQNFFVFDHPV